MLRKVLRFLQNEDGPTAVEYAVMLALIIIVCVLGIQAVGENVSASYNDSRDELNEHFNAAGVGQ